MYFKVKSTCLIAALLALEVSIIYISMFKCYKIVSVFEKEPVLSDYQLHLILCYSTENK